MNNKFNLMLALAFSEDIKSYNTRNVKKINGETYIRLPYKYVDIKVNTEHFIKCPAQRWNLNKRDFYIDYEPCCEKDWNLYKRGI